MVAEMHFLLPSRGNPVVAHLNSEFSYDKCNTHLMKHKAQILFFKNHHILKTKGFWVSDLVQFFLSCLFKRSQQ